MGKYHKNAIKQVSTLINQAASLVREPSIFTLEDLEEATEAMENLVAAWNELSMNNEKTISH
jgi:hypothetical protein